MGVSIKRTHGDHTHMSRVSITAVAAIACVALAVPAAASAKDEAATAAAIGPGTPLTVNLPSESEWTTCATEGARCAFTGTQQVRYGADGKFLLPRTFTDGVACDNAAFGIDPAPGVVKQCQVTGLSQMKDEAATAAAIGPGTQLQVNLPAESEWTFCATEGARCAFTGTKQVRYGTDGKFLLPRTFTDGVDCGNAAFGVDPAPGVVKQCQIAG
jgi:hypothetical protein